MRPLDSRASGTGCCLHLGSCWDWLSSTEKRARGLEKERCLTEETGMTREVVEWEKRERWRQRERERMNRLVRLAEQEAGEGLNQIPCCTPGQLAPTVA